MRRLVGLEREEGGRGEGKRRWRKRTQGHLRESHEWRMEVCGRELVIVILVVLVMFLVVLVMLVVFAMLVHET